MKNHQGKFEYTHTTHAKNKYITVYIYSSSLFDADFDNGPL